MHRQVSKHRRRSTLEIITDVLLTIKTRHKRTRVMYKANLSWNPMQRLLSFLEERGLITIQKNLVYLTPKGVGLLKELLKVCDTLGFELPFSNHRNVR